MPTSSVGTTFTEMATTVLSTRVDAADRRHQMGEAARREQPPSASRCANQLDLPGAGAVLEVLPGYEIRSHFRAVNSDSRSSWNVWLGPRTNTARGRFSINADSEVLTRDRAPWSKPFCRSPKNSAATWSGA